jgi:uncharacterized protein YfaS (alpha-2-macroglobulin family)
VLRRRSRLLGGSLAALLCAGVLGGACSSDRDRGSDGSLADEDRPDNGVVAVNEALITGRIEAGLLKVEVPVSSLVDRAAKGALRVHLRSVDGSTSLGTVDVPYELDPRASALLELSLPAPEATTQPELVDFSVRVDDGTSSGLRITRSLLRVVPPHDIRIDGPAKLRQKREATYRVRAEDAYSHKPLPGVKVELGLSQKGLTKTLSATTGETGDAVFNLSLADVGAAEIDIAVEGSGVKTTASAGLDVELPGQKLLLTTDKPIYKPGQTVYLRALALNRGDNTPLAGQNLDFEIEDGKGNKIFKKTLTTDAFGIAATPFRIGQIVNEGEFKVRIGQGEAKTEKTVKVGQYALPKFDVTIGTDKAFYLPGETVNGSIDARYFFGKSVAGGDVKLEAATLDIGETVFRQVLGTLDANGRFSFTVALPSSLAGLPLEQGQALVVLRAIVTDTAGQEVTKQIVLNVTQQAASVVIVPEGQQIVPGVDNALLVFVTDPLGAPVPNAPVTVAAPDGRTLSATTDAFGQASLTYAAPLQLAGKQSFSVTAVLPGGSSASKTADFSAQAGGKNLIVRTDKAVYETGETVSVEVQVSEVNSTVYVDWLNEGQAVDMRTLHALDGKATFSMDVDVGLMGSNRIEAYVVDDDGNIVRAGRTVFARGESSLSIDVRADKALYVPGEEAKLSFSVTDAAGAGAVTALGVQIVDRAVFSLIDAQPALLRTYFELNDQFAEPQYEIEGPRANLTELLYTETSSPDPEKAGAAQKNLVATLAAMSNTSLTGLSVRTWPSALLEAVRRLAPVYTQEQTRLTSVLKQIADGEAAKLKSAGCTDSVYYCDAHGDTYANLLTKAIAANTLAADLWGNRYAASAVSWGDAIELRTLGPDEVAGTSDDQALTINLSDLGITLNREYQDPAAGNGTGTGGTTGGWPSDGPAGAGTVDEGGSGAPRVRRDFPETLYVNPAIITGPDGKATLSVPLADSITEWRISTLANTKQGKLGGSQSGLVVFQDFFVDVNFPATLTRGDQIAFPIAVYNYLEEPQTVNLTLEPANWYTPGGATAQQVTLGAGEVAGVSFPVTVESVGLHTLTVQGIGSAKSDAVARTVRVVPDGKQFPTVHSGMIASGSTSQVVSFPAEAVPGSEELYVEVFPAFLSQVVQGMDSMLAVPNGCFEQTTSTTWPNVLVTDYMQQTGQITPAIQMKAESLISAGYQRLLTFEHPGGGFSWFGTQDAAPYLSVTAFGLMEFADMGRVHHVDEAMVKRTQDWLLSQQAANGSWAGDVSEFFSFNSSTVRNTAFVVWALTSAGYSGSALTQAVSYLKSNLTLTDDAYTLAMAANALVAAAPNDSVTTSLLARLDTLKVGTDSYSWDSGDTQTTFYGYGDDAKVTTTALVVHALLASGSYKAAAEGGIKFLTEQKDPNGNFGSTQATIWTLRTLLLAAKKGTEGAVGSFVVSVDGAPQRTLNLTADQADVMTVVDLSHLATTGEHSVGLAFTGTGKVSYSIVARHHLPWSLVPAEAPGPLSVSVSYDKTSLRVNESVKTTVAVKNNTTAQQDMILVTLGIPPGFQVRTSDLDAYVLGGALSRYETTGRQLILYVRTLAGSATQSFVYNLVATMPVTAADGGATIQPYYQPKQLSATASKTFTVSAN